MTIRFSLGTGHRMGIDAPDDRRGGAIARKDRRFAAPITNSWREPPSRPKILRFSASRRRFFDCSFSIDLIHKR